MRVQSCKFYCAHQHPLKLNTALCRAHQNTLHRPPLPRLIINHLSGAALCRYDAPPVKKDDDLPFASRGGGSEDRVVRNPTYSDGSSISGAGTRGRIQTNETYVVAPFSLHLSELVHVADRKIANGIFSGHLRKLACVADHKITFGNFVAAT